MIVILTKTRYITRIKKALKENHVQARIFTVKTIPKKIPVCDLGVSYCYPRLLTRVELNIPKNGWINYHPAPLPRYKGGDPYTQGIMDHVTKWGITIHKMTGVYDTGKIITVEKIDLGYSPITREELGAIAHHYCYKLFKDTISMFSKGNGLYPWQYF